MEHCLRMHWIYPFDKNFLPTFQLYFVKKITTFFNSYLFTVVGNWCLNEVFGSEEKRRNVKEGLYHRGSNHTI
jgi:hypothetical protein